MKAADKENKSSKENKLLIPYYNLRRSERLSQKAREKRRLVKLNSFTEIHIQEIPLVAPDEEPLSASQENNLELRAFTESVKAQEKKRRFPEQRYHKEAARSQQAQAVNPPAGASSSLQAPLLQVVRACPEDEPTKERIRQANSLEQLINIVHEILVIPTSLPKPFTGTEVANMLRARPELRYVPSAFGIRKKYQYYVEGLLPDNDPEAPTPPPTPPVNHSDDNDTFYWPASSSSSFSISRRFFSRN